MKAVRIRINDLIDNHGDTFYECPGCPTCNEITKLRANLDRDSEQRFAHILAKGREMKTSEIKFLLENDVKRKAIRKALGMPEEKFCEMIKNLGLQKREGNNDMSAVKIEKYQDFKAKGLTDAQIAKEMGITGPTLSYHKKKWFNETEKPKLAIVEPKQGDNSPKDKTAEYKALIAQLKEEVKASEESEARLVKRVKELEESHNHIHAACEDLEKETIRLQEEKEKLEKDSKAYRDQLLDTRDKLVRQDYTLENQKHALEHTRTTLERYEKENKAIRELLALWI